MDSKYGHVDISRNVGNLQGIVALFPEHRWIRRVLALDPRQGRLRRTFMTWDSPLQHFSRWQHQRCLDFCYIEELCNSVGFTPCALCAADWHAGANLKVMSFRFFTDFFLASLLAFITVFFLGAHLLIFSRNCATRVLST